ncbi:MAG: Acyl-[acyl-carrier-protein]--UDP-N-acetylglucosamine O-acyltransferase [Candidatus Anoxychlamydiales bacterium]|nr:Acyl-[acyl-carrier-protein]--UDP-N-acetylglucosamine O-acyltransferase [Candidatus Anoxychlamydiales bacterium]
MSKIDSRAYIEEGAKIGKDVTIEPFAVIKKNVVIEDRVVIKSNAYLDGNTTIKEGSTIWPGASIGTKTQDLKFQGEETFVIIGKNTEIREYATINSSCNENSTVSIGDNCLIMAYCHVAHNCRVGNRVIMANGAMLAGHVVVEDNAVIGGMTPVHQFARIGTFSMVGGFSRVSHDIPPYTIGGGYPYRLGGLNLVGLKRNNFSLETRNVLGEAFKIVYRMGLRLDIALEKIEKELILTKELEHFLNFCKTTKRGLIGLEGITKLNQKEANIEEFEKV